MHIVVHHTFEDRDLKSKYREETITGEGEVYISNLSSTVIHHGYLG
jgi:hypothetical protein